MHRSSPLLLTLLFAPAALAQGPGGPPGPGLPPLPPVPVPAENPITEAKRVLGKALFFEEQLSSSDRVSCATCHINGAGGADPRFGVEPGDQPFGGDDVLGSPGVVRSDDGNDFEFDTVFGFEPQVTGRTAQPVHGSQFAPELFWDGRASSTFVDPETGQVSILQGGGLESQAVGPILSDVEMAHTGRTWDQVRAKLESVRPLALATDLPNDLASAIALSPTYPDLFEDAFGDPAIDAERIAFAIATYERTLIPDQSPFDAFLAGDGTALTAQQMQGFDAFNATTCNVCHSGPNLTDDVFHAIGVRPPAEDQGRFEVTGAAPDMGRFKTPSLRNVGLRDRYMHNGQFGTLDEVIDFYVGAPGTQMFPQNLSPLVQNTAVPPNQRAALVAFLEEALTDPRAAAELFPFDRPTLASEREDAEVVELGPGHAGTDAVVPRWMPISPAAAGSPDFRLGLRDSAPNAIAFMAVGVGAATPGASVADAPLYLDPAGLLALEALVTDVAVDGSGFGTCHLPIPDVTALVGLPLASQWFVADAGASGGLAATSGLAWTIQ